MQKTLDEKIVFISDMTNFLLVSIKDKLKDMGYRVVNCKLNIDDIARIERMVEAIVIPVSEEMASKPKEMTYIKDHALENDFPIFTLGNRDELSVIDKFIPKSMIAQEFSRPIDVGQLTDSLDDYIAEYREHKRKKILVVDDSGTMLRNVKNWLEEKYQVILANSATMALKYLALNQTDLILLDYEMHVCDGKQLMEMMRADGDYNTVPIIFLTGKNDRQSIAQVTVMKPDGYLLKTIPPAQIVRAIDDFFEKQKAQKNAE